MRDLSSLETLRAATATMRDLPRVLKLVRSTFRAQERRPQLEPAYVSFVERYVRFYHSKPLGLLDETHARAFLTHIARRPGMTAARQDLAREALLFFHNEVLHQQLDDVTGFVRAPDPAAVTTSGDRTASSSTRSFWTLHEASDDE